METTVYIEIPVTITFSVDPGQKQTHWDPGYPPQIEDIDFDNDQVISAVENEIYGEDSTIHEELMEKAKEARREDAEYAAEMAYEAYKESLKPCPF